MSADTWEAFLDQLLLLGVDAIQALVRIALIVVAAAVGARILRAALNRLEAWLVRGTVAHEAARDAAARRIRTLTHVLWTIATGVLWFLVVVIVLGQIGINVGPILASAGVVALAVGFGTQHLVRDLVSGFFLLLENQLRVGDAAVINGKPGLVEAVTFRTVILRDEAGVVHVFPNGLINTLSNTTMDWSAYVIDVSLSPKEDPDRAMEVMRRVGEDMERDERYRAQMLAPIEIFGVDNFRDSLVWIKARLKTQPLHQYRIGREYRRRLKKAFDAEQIETPFSKPAAGPAQPPAATRAQDANG
jgi:small conductance mechanosensitive channel